MPDSGPPPPPSSREEVVELSGCITLDVSKDSDRFLGCVKDSLDNNHIPYMVNQQQGSTRLLQALQNLDSCKSAKNAMVIGHGQPGFIHVDGGDYYVGDRISAIADLQDGGPGDQPWNESEWKGFVNQHLKSRFKQITLLGCDTGKPRDKNNIVPTMAAQSAATVMAPTGKVWCDPKRQKVIIDKADGWSTVSGSGVLRKKRREARQQEYGSGIGKASVLPTLLGLLLAAPDVSVSLCLMSTPFRKFHTDDPCPVLSPEARKKLVASIFEFETPFQTSYISGADRTGSITISSSRMHQSIHIDILNDDVAGYIPIGIYYRVSDTLSSSWEGLLE
jgi:hypothetical protein